MRKFLKSKKCLIGMICVILFLVLIVFIVFFSKNNSEKIKGVAIHVTDYSDGFTDEGFYACVVNSYNKENDTQYLTNQKLTDDQLASIKTVECNTSGDKYRYDKKSGFSYGHPNYNEDLIQLYKDNVFLGYTGEFYSEYFFDNYDIKNIDGIEKLTGLEKFVAVILEDDSVDFSKNTNLKHLDLYLPSTVKKLDLTNNENLTNLLIDSAATEFEYIGFEKLTKLIELYISNSNYINPEYSFPELSNYSKLEKLSLLNVGFKNLTPIKDLENLKELAVEDSFSSAETKDMENGNVEFTSLSELKSLKELTYLYFNYNASIMIGELPELPKLISLDSKIIQSFDLSKLVNLKKLKLHNLYEISPGGVNAPISKLSFFEELEQLKNLEYLIIGNGYPYSGESSSWRYIDSLDWFPKLHTVIINNGYYYTNFIGTETLRSIYTLNGNFSSATDVEYVENFYGYSVSDLDYSNLKDMYIRGGDCEKLNSINTSTKIEELVFSTVNYCEINSSLLENSPNLKKAYISNLNFDTDRIDLSNFKNLETFILKNTNDNYRERIVGVFDNPNLKNYKGYIDSSIPEKEMNNIEYLDINSTNKNIDFSLLPNLKYLNSRIDTMLLDLSNNKELLYLNMGSYHWNQKILIQNSNKLNFLKIRSSTIPSEQYLVSKKPSKIKNNISLPAQFKYEISSNDAGIRFIGDSVVADELGSYSLEFAINNYNPAAIMYKCSSNYNDANYSLYNARSFNIYFNVLDIYSKKYKIDYENGYMYVGTDTKEKNIINGVYFLPMETPGLSYGAVNKNNFVTFLMDKNVDEMKIVKVMSNKYKIKDNTITYYGDFDINNVRVTNAQTELDGNKLIIKSNNKIVDEYSLVKLNSLIGDVNDDGEVSISDIILQYKHTNYDLDLEEDQFYRADIDENEDVINEDVDMLYEIIKNNQGGKYE